MKVKVKVKVNGGHLIQKNWDQGEPTVWESLQLHRDPLQLLRRCQRLVQSTVHPSPSKSIAYIMIMVLIIYSNICMYIPAVCTCMNNCFHSRFALDLNPVHV